MQGWIVLPTLVVMVLGLAGTVIPVLPGLAIIWVAGIASMALAGWTGGAWVVTVLMTLCLVGATAAKLALPVRAGRVAGAPRSSLLLAAAAGLVGFFVIPVVGFVIGGITGLYLAERARLSDGAAAWRTTRSVVYNVGVAALIELVAGVTMIAVWLVPALR